MRIIVRISDEEQSLLIGKIKYFTESTIRAII